MLLSTAKQTAWAAVGDVVGSGTCGDKLTWTLTENEDAAVTYNSNTFTALTLTITGTGAMADYASGSDTPWWNDKIGITRLVLPDGLTHVGSDAFYGLYFATSVTLPAAVTSIGNDAFKNVGSHASSCSFTAAEGSLLSSIGTDGFKGFGGNVDLRNCTSLTTIGEKVFEDYKTNKVYLPVSMRTVAKDAFYSTTYSNNKPKVYVRCQNSVLAVNGEYKTSSTGTVSTQITSYLDLKAKSSAAVSISQICFDDIALTWDSDGKFFAIADEQDLIDLAEYVKGGSDHGCEGVTFKMTADLDFTDMPDNYHDKYDRGSGNFLPIGLDNGTLFKGHFDGDGHTITGLRFDYEYTHVGLFRAIASAYAVVEGVTLVCPNFSAYNEVGGIAGGLQQGIVRNCAVVGGTLSVSNECVGGIVGFSNYYDSSSIKSISGCTVVGTTLSGPQYVGIIVGFNTGTSDANAALTISGCTYHNPDGLDVCGYGYKDRYTDGGGNKRVYQARLSDGLTAATAAYSHGHDYYFTEGTAVTLGHGDRPGYDFGGYESSDVTISEGAFEMPASDVSVTATWKKLLTNTDISVVAINDQEWTGSGITPAVTVKDGTTDISGECDFAYSDNQNTGTATITITAKAASTGYSGSTTKTFEIVPKVTNYGAMTLTEDQTGKTATLDGNSDEPFAITSDIVVNQVVLNRGFTANKKVTVCLPFEVTEAQVAELGKFYYFSGVTGEGKIEMTQVTGALTAHTPYIFEPSSSRTTFDFGAKTILADTPSTTSNSGLAFKGIYNRIKWTTATTDALYNADRAAELGKAYGFALENKTVGTKTYEVGQFVKLGDGAHSRAFRAYLLYDGTWDGTQPTSSAPRRSNSSQPNVIEIVWKDADGNVTGVGASLVNSEERIVNSEAWYTIDGRRLDKQPSTKGLYINNGRKVVVK